MLSLFVISIFLAGAYLLYQFILYENYTKGRWKRGTCVHSSSECKFGETCVKTDCPQGIYCQILPGSCEPQMNDFMEKVFGENEQLDEERIWR